MLEQVKANLEKSLPNVLVSQLLETYGEVKREYYLGHLRPNEVEGGRFSEAVFRILEFRTTGKFTPLGKQLVDFEKRCEGLRNIQSSVQPDSIRLHIPRTIRLVYDIRNKRDAGHLADGIDPNLQDATFVVACCDWVMAELIRLYHSVDANEAHRIVDSLVTRKIPAIQEFGDFLKTLNPFLSVSERVLVLLYHCGSKGASLNELSSWIKPSQRTNLRRTLANLEHEGDAIIHRAEKYYITARGIKNTESKRLLESV